MTMLLTIFLAGWAVLLIAPDTPIGRMLHRVLVGWPAERLSRIRGGHVLLVLLLASMVATAWWLFEGDGVRMLSMGAPEIATFVTSIEVTTYLDVLAALIVSASTLRLQALRGVAARAIARLRLNRPRIPRTRRARAERPANDDDDGAVLGEVVAA